MKCNETHSVNEYWVPDNTALVSSSGAGSDSDSSDDEGDSEITIDMTAMDHSKYLNVMNKFVVDTKDVTHNFGERMILGADIDGYTDYLIITARALSSKESANVYVSFDWDEVI